MKNRWVTSMTREVEAQLRHGSDSELMAQWRSAGQFHLAVFVEPFLSYILDGRKTVESRFSVTRMPPYGRVTSGDLLLLKRSGGPVVGMCRVTQCWTYSLTGSVSEEIRRKFGKAICASAAFWNSKRGARYVTLMAIDSTTPLDPVYVYKRDPRAWVVVENQRRQQLELIE